MSSSTPTLSVASLPAIGAELLDGNYAGVTTSKDGSLLAVVLLPAAAPEHMTWPDAKRWASTVGGELPTRPVAALLYANVKPSLAPDWHWTADTFDADTGDEEAASYAWSCTFGYGSQYCYHQDFKGSAVAVRMIPLAL